MKSLVIMMLLLLSFGASANDCSEVRKSISSELGMSKCICPDIRYECKFNFNYHFEPTVACPNDTSFGCNFIGSTYYNFKDNLREKRIKRKVNNAIEWCKTRGMSVQHSFENGYSCSF